MSAPTEIEVLRARLAAVEALIADGSEVPDLRMGESGPPVWTVTVGDIRAALAKERRRTGRCGNPGGAA